MSSFDPATPKAKKSLGQNFLQDANIARKIVDALRVGPDDFVVEIGPGPGALTSIIAERAPARLLLVEKDEYWAGERRDTKVPGGTQPEVLCADALAVAWEGFPAPWKCIGNLPYNVASPLMWEIFSRARGLSRAVFMIQKEVGQRLTAEPGTGAYGALSVWVRTFMRPRIEFIVPPQVFIPRPKVDSAVLSFEPLDDVPSLDDCAALAKTLHRCFQQRRKQLGTILKGTGLTEDALPPESGIVFTVRPERLTPGQFLLLARALRENAATA
ncbi:MAG: 16S rRNA (adenine(1518)-N(6)/adenine(1519)-N(6))-dimethyltransferase RsmA [Deltaproteobacteria bacterium]|nr:16S rRNA (adenine(1518)-N(6)/adenine(1519)-N(6))-dimethyltransferase RsmA [Deltaproteobacteria bacterium]